MVVKLLTVTSPEYKHYDNADMNTIKLLSQAHIESFIQNKTFDPNGINSITNGESSGLQNRNINFKDKQFYEENGFYSNAKFTWIG